VANVLDIHAEIFVSVAFARPYNDPKWKNARIAARELITGTLVNDVQDVSAAIKQLCKLLAGRETVPPSCFIRKQIWAKCYVSLQTDDADGIVTIISIIVRSSHLDTLNKKAFSPAFQRTEVSGSAEVAFEDINRSLTIIRSGFLEALSKYANYNISTSVLALLRRPGVVKDVMILMFSPLEDFQVAAQTLVGQAFDVDGRLDCFRALLEHSPDSALDGIFDFLETFIQCSPIVPEACSLSKSLVRCLTDVIEVLCAGHNALLQNDRFLKAVHKSGSTSALPRLWTLMTKSITVIFKRTPSWSVYFENEDMIVWMRDALIFGRDMLAQRRVIESAAVLASEQCSSSEVSKPLESSSFGKKMINDLQDVLPELARWLRLTDEELLHQSFALLQSLLECFRESGIRPSPVGIGKLTKHIDDARKKDPSRPQTRLDSTRLSKLEDALAAFDDDDDIEIISHTLPPL
jgi:senataxin